MIKSFARFGGKDGARQFAEELAGGLAKGSKSSLLTSNQAKDALDALERLQQHFEDTGVRVNLKTGINEYCEVMAKLKKRSLNEAVAGYLANVVTVQRQDIVAAVGEFILNREPKTKPEKGKLRPALCPKYHYNTASWLREFAAAFPGHAVVDLTKEHINLYMAKQGELGTKSRNDRRAIVKQFLRWCVRQDYLPATHRLLEADGLTMEHLDDAAIDFYKPAELRALLEAADTDMRPVIALQGLAGLRLEEVMRLNWQDVFGIAGHVEVDSSKSKTRQRRLVEIVPALSAWLRPYRRMEGKVAGRWDTTSGYVQSFIALLKKTEVAARRNGLRHGFVSYDFALNNNENLTGSRVGTAPALLHRHYRGKATRQEAKKWFAVRPVKPANVIELATAAR